MTYNLYMAKNEKPAPTIRRARPSDAAWLAALCTQLGYPTTLEEARLRFEQIGPREDQAIFVAEEGGEVIGWLHLYVCPLLEMDLHAEIGGLVVAEDQRGGGVGRQLIEHAGQWARQQGCKNLYVRSNVIRRRAHEFYEQIGFQIIKTQHSFLKKLP